MKDKEKNNDLEIDTLKENIKHNESERTQLEAEYMDIEKAIDKSERSKKKGFFNKTFTITVIILIFAIVSVGIYAPIKDAIMKKDSLEKYIGSHDFAFFLTDLIRHINRTEFQNKEAYNNKYENLENIKYYIKSTRLPIEDGETPKIASNLSDINESQLEKERANSRFYIKATIDDKGNPTIVNLKTTAFRKLDFTDSLKNFYQYDLNDLSDLDIQIFLPEKLGPAKDAFTYSIKNFYLQQNMLLIFIIAGIGLLTLIIFAFAMPFSSQNESKLVRLFNNAFLEFKFLIYFCILMVDIGVMQITAYNGPIYTGFDIAEIIYDANMYFYFIGIAVAFTIYYLAYLSICYVKYIYHNGFKKGLVKKTIIGRLFFYMANKINEIINIIIDEEASKEHKKKLVCLLVLNFLILGAITFNFFLGWAIAIGYSVFLFDYLLKKLDKVRELNKASNELSKGNFDIILNEDMGILSPFAKNLNNIKEGFRIAVDREVKSQNMKTELITNVSHDLKTPLTSIITYIDLLKTEDVDEDTQRDYIDVLDKKSKRLKVLIDDLFDISKASSGNIELYLEELDVIALLRQMLGELEEKIEESDLIFKVNLPEYKVLSNLDGRKTYRIFDNIMSNILKYSMANSRVYIDTEEKDESISFIFRNIASYEMNFDSTNILERFTRGDSSRSTDGSGLGLAIAKSLTELQKGSLSVSVDGDLFKLIATFPKLKNL